MTSLIDDAFAEVSILPFRLLLNTSSLIIWLHVQVLHLSFKHAFVYSRQIFARNQVMLYSLILWSKTEVLAAEISSIYRTRNSFKLFLIFTDHVHLYVDLNEIKYHPYHHLILFCKLWG